MFLEKTNEKLLPVICAKNEK